MSLSPFNLILLSCSSLLGNPLRSGLTTVGVFMGVMAVSATLQVGEISRAVIAKQLAEQDAPQMILYRKYNPQVRQVAELTIEDVQFLQQRLVGTRAVSGMNWGDQPQVMFQAQQATPEMYAVTVDYLTTIGRKLLDGRSFNSTDFEQYRPVALIDKFLADKLFENQKPIGQRIYIDLKPYLVVGVIASQPSQQEPEGELYIPTAIFSALTGSRSLHAFRVRPNNIDEMEPIQKQAIKLLEQRFPGFKFGSWIPIEEILNQKKTLESVSQALLVVGLVALLVGGVGIANITIAAVMERTPEIGLRRALGATQLDILCQFILEAAILSLVGGGIAIATVHGITVVVSKQFELPYQFQPKTAGLALSSALAVGLGASFFPALRASQLDPVKALRDQ